MSGGVLLSAESEMPRAQDPVHTEDVPQPEKEADNKVKSSSEQVAEKSADAKSDSHEKKGSKKPPVKNGKKQPGKQPQKKPPKSTGQLFLSFLIKVSVIAAVVWATFTFVLGLSVHYGNNMHPSVRDGDLIVTYRLQRPFINSVVLYKVDGKVTVGRVIALEGSSVAISEAGEFTVNGVTTTEEVFYQTFPAEGSDIEYPYVVEKGKMFILNDFRRDTYDSRTFGAVDKSDVLGPALFTLRRREF